MNWDRFYLTQGNKEFSEAVVILGIGGSYMEQKRSSRVAAEPYYNELSMGNVEASSNLSNSLDNDALQSLMTRLADSRWSICSDW